MKERIENIIIEIIGLILLVEGMSKLYIIYHGEKYQALIQNNIEKFEELTSDSIGWFFAQHSFWKMGVLLTGAIILILFKYFKIGKKGILNTIVSVISVYALLRFGILKSNLFDGIFFSLIGVWIIWKYNLKRHKTQQWL